MGPRQKREEPSRTRFRFVYAAKIFEGPTLEADDPRGGYGERRIRAVGGVSGDILLIVYTWRGDVRPIISARKASRKERDA